MSTIISWNDNRFICNSNRESSALMEMQRHLPNGYHIAVTGGVNIIITPDKRAYDLTIKQINEPQFITGDLVK